MGRFLIAAGAVAVLAVTASSGGMHSARAASGPSGEAVFKSHCAMCHSIRSSGGPSVGPHLFAVVGRKAGSVPRFNYSKAMKASGIVWTPANLKRYIVDPKLVVPGNHMPFAGMHDTAQVDALVAYLESVK